MTCKQCVHYNACKFTYIEAFGSFNEEQFGQTGCAEFEEAKRGEWEVCSDEYEICASEFVCSNCKESFVSSDLTDEQFFEMMKYCPNCGAKMDGERKEK